MKGKPQFNHEGYRDTVPYRAIRNIERDNRRQQTVSRPKRRGRKNEDFIWQQQDGKDLEK